MKDVEVNFPLIEDITMEVAKLYGMIQPNEDSTKAVRAVFFIDPKGIVRAMIYYPLSLGRNFDELYRALIAMQAADAFGVAPPPIGSRVTTSSSGPPAPAAPPRTAWKARKTWSARTGSSVPEN